MSDDEPVPPHGSDEPDEPHGPGAPEAPPLSTLADVDLIEEVLVGKRTLDRQQVSDEAGVPLELAQELWQQLGFPHAEDGELAFTDRDVEALELTSTLISLGVLTPESQSALVRTWGRAYARLAEWQVHLLADVALQSDQPEQRLAELVEEVLPRVEQLQSYVWRRHLASAANRLLARSDDSVGNTSTMAVAFVDIVGYTSRSKHLEDRELVDWVEHFEDTMARLVVERGGRIIKAIGDAVLFVADDPVAAAEVTLTATALGADEDDPFPQVRAGMAYGEVVTRLGDVFGPTVNIASRLTSIARPSSVLIDRGAFDELSALDPPEERDAETEHRLSRILERATDELAELSPYTTAGDYRFRKMPRRNVKGYSRLEPWVLRRRERR